MTERDEGTVGTLIALLETSMRETVVDLRCSTPAPAVGIRDGLRRLQPDPTH